MERLRLQDVAEALGVKVSQISRLLKAIGERFELPGVDLTYEDFDITDYFENKLLTVEDGVLIVRILPAYPGHPSYDFRLDKFIAYAKERYTKHDYYRHVHFIARQLPHVVSKALAKARQMGKDLDQAIETLKKVIAEFEEARE